MPTIGIAPTYKSQLSLDFDSPAIASAPAATPAPASATPPKVFVISTTDRMQFRTCRRRWHFQSSMALNLEPVQMAAPLWFGTGIHFALEDFHGENRYARPEAAFEAYVEATQRQSRQVLPGTWSDDLQRSINMLSYYHKYWLKNRDPLPTLIVDGVPQVEVNLRLDLRDLFEGTRLGGRSIDDIVPHLKDYDQVIYSATIDRVTEDIDGNIWLVDYKTTAQMKTTHHSLDAQASAYTWLASRYYDKPVKGLIYWQFLKATPQTPRILNNGHLSVAANMRTSSGLYEETAKEVYGSPDKFPDAVARKLESLRLGEGKHHDTYIRRDYLRRSESQLANEGLTVLMELRDMLDPDKPLYHNPTFLCPAMCPFYEVCYSMQDGSDFQIQLEATTQKRADKDESWRAYLQPVDEFMEHHKDFATPVEYEEKTLVNDISFEGA